MSISPIMELPHFKSIAMEQVGTGYRATVQCDRDRPNGLSHLIGYMVLIDQKPYELERVESPAGPIPGGGRMVLLVTPEGTGEARGT